MTIGHIYKIVSKHTNKIYIGSTTQSLIKRLVGHETDYKMYQLGKTNYRTSFEILEFDQCHIELIESIEFDSKTELQKLEGHYIQTFKAICVNRNIAGQTISQYYIQNKGKINKHNREYYIQNKDKINKHKNEILTCSCGKKYTRGNKSHHERSNYHISNLNISA